MSEIWAITVGVIVLLIIYGIISSKLKERRQQQLREKSLPFIENCIRQGVSYNIYLSDGKKYMNVQLAGTSDPASGQFTIGGWEGMLILMQTNGKRAFLRQCSIRCIEEV